MVITQLYPPLQATLLYKYPYNTFEQICNRCRREPLLQPTMECCHYRLQAIPVGDLARDAIATKPSPESSSTDVFPASDLFLVARLPPSRSTNVDGNFWRKQVFILPSGQFSSNRKTDQRQASLHLDPCNAAQTWAGRHRCRPVSSSGARRKVAKRSIYQIQAVIYEASVRPATATSNHVTSLQTPQSQNFPVKLPPVYAISRLTKLLIHQWLNNLGQGRAEPNFLIDLRPPKFHTEPKPKLL